MNALDRVISWVSPQAGYHRQMWREASRSAYDAAGHGRTNRNWRVLNDSAQNIDYPERDTIRARARDLERNSDIANAILAAYQRNVIGRGYNLQARTDDEDFNAAVEKLWKEWQRARNCDVTGQQNFTQLLRMALNRKKVDGGVLIKKCYTRGGLLPLKLQLLEVDELDITRVSAHGKKNRVVGGIEYDQYNKPVGYWIKQYSIDGTTYRAPEYCKASDIIFYWSKKRPSQIREISDLTPTIARIRDTNEYINAVAIKERVAACLAVFIKRATPAGGFGRTNALPGEERRSYDGKTLAPGMIGELNLGESLDVVNPGNSGSDTANFLKVQQRMIGSGQGLSYEAVSRDMSDTNYSSARQAIIEDENTYAEEIQMLKECVMDEVYEAFVMSASLAGLLPAKGFWDNKREYFAHQWVSSPKKWIDPSKEATANKVALATGQKTYQDICAENGKDWQEQIDDMARAMEYAGNLGIELGGILYGREQK